MKKGTKQPNIGVVLLKSTGLSLGGYLLGILLMAFGAVRTNVRDTVLFSVMAGICILSSFLGGTLAARRLPWGTLPSALLGTGCYGMIMMLVGLCAWDQLSVSGRGGVLLLCVIAGGAIAGLAGSRKKVHRKRK